jgi:hypothetical protein
MTWLVILGVLAVLAVGLMFVNAKSKADQVAKVAHAAPPESPYAAIAGGKADIEGGVIQVAARAPGWPARRTTRRAWPPSPPGPISPRPRPRSPPSTCRSPPPTGNTSGWSG